MTIKYQDKNVSAENDIKTLYDIVIGKDPNTQKVNSVVFTRKNFYTDQNGESYNLTNDFYTKTEIDERVKIHLKIYDTEEELEAATDDEAKRENYIYLVPYLDQDGEFNEGHYKEYVYAKDKNGTYHYEEVGSTELDLSPIRQRLSALEEGKVDKEQVDPNDNSAEPRMKVLSDNNFSDLLKSKLNGIEENANQTILASTISENEPNPVSGGVIKTFVENKISESYQEFSDQFNDIEDEDGILDGYVIKDSVVDNLNSNSSQAPLSANQGRILKAMIDNKSTTSYSETQQGGSDNSYEIGRLTIDNTETVLYGKDTVTDVEEQLVGYVKQSDLADVATTGSYNDLDNKPNIPTVTDTVEDNNSNAVTSNAVYGAIQFKENTSNKVTTLDTSSSHYPSCSALSPLINFVEQMVNISFTPTVEIDSGMYFIHNSKINTNHKGLQLFIKIGSNSAVTETITTIGEQRIGDYFYYNELMSDNLSDNFNVKVISPISGNVLFNKTYDKDGNVVG